MSTSVLSGGISTLLGVMVLALARSEAFRTFFRVFATAVSLGTFCGVAVSPVILSILHSGMVSLARPFATQASRSGAQRTASDGDHECFQDDVILSSSL